MTDIEPGELFDVLASDKPPIGTEIDGPLVTITGQDHRLIIQIGTSETGRLIPTGFIVGCEDPPRQLSPSVMRDYSFREIMSYLNRRAIAELKEEAPPVIHPGKHGWPDSHFEMVAKTYNNRVPNQPIRVLAAQYRVTSRTFYRWLQTARDRGFLPQDP